MHKQESATFIERPLAAAARPASGLQSFFEDVGFFDNGRNAPLDSLKIPGGLCTSSKEAVNVIGETRASCFASASSTEFAIRPADRG